MNLKYIQGDLIEAALDGRLNVIAHQANCFCKGRRGIAPQIFGRFPSLKLADDRTEIGDRDKLGTITHSFCYRPNIPKSNFLWGFNLYGQYHFDQKSPEYGTRYPALQSALESMRQMIILRKTLYWNYEDVLNIGFPLIGCGVAGGDWNIVEEMIKEVFEGLPNVEIYIYTLDKLEGKNYE